MALEFSISFSSSFGESGQYGLSSGKVLKLCYVSNKQQAGEISLDNFAPLDITSVPVLSLIAFIGELCVKPDHTNKDLNSIRGEKSILLILEIVKKNLRKWKSPEDLKKAR